MRVQLAPRRMPAYAGAEQGRVYAYEAARNWFSLDPNSPYRGPEGAKRIANSLFNDYNDDGKFTLASGSVSDRASMTVKYIPPISARVETRADSTIYYKTQQLPGGAGAIESRLAIANK